MKHTRRNIAKRDEKLSAASETPCPTPFARESASRCARRLPATCPGTTSCKLPLRTSHSATLTTKADPRAERLSADAGPGREWIVVGEVKDPLFDIRVWRQHFYSFFPEGPRNPNSPFAFGAPPICSAPLFIAMRSPIFAGF